MLKAISTIMGFYDKVHVVAKTATQLNPSHRANIKQLAQEISFVHFSFFIFTGLCYPAEKAPMVFCRERLVEFLPRLVVAAARSKNKKAMYTQFGIRVRKKHTKLC